MTFFLSREGRKYFHALKNVNDDNILAYRIACDQLAMNRSESVVKPDLRKKHDVIELAQLPATLPDAPKIRLLDHLKSYRYLTEEFVVGDFPRVDLLKMASAMLRFDSHVIKKFGDQAKAQKVFAVSYLMAMLEKSGAAAFEEVRRESRMEEMSAERPMLVLPDHRPTNILQAMDGLAEERKINDALKGRY